MPNGTYGGVRGRKTKVGRKLLRFPPTRFFRVHVAATGRSKYTMMLQIYFNFYSIQNKLILFPIYPVLFFKLRPEQ